MDRGNPAGTLLPLADCAAIQSRSPALARSCTAGDMCPGRHCLEHWQLQQRIVANAAPGRIVRRPTRGGIREVDQDIWQVRFLEYDLGYSDKKMRGRVEPGPSPFAPDKVLTMCPV